MTVLTVDCRESKIIQKLKDQNEKFHIESMDIGDFSLHDENYHLIVERKTWLDLRASIRDNRFREQRSRLREWKSSHQNRQIMYMIEGMFEPEFANERRTCERLMIGYTIPVLFMESMDGVVRQLQDWKQMCSLEKLFQTRDILQDQVESRIRKKNYDDPSLFFQTTLCQMKGITTSMARAISHRFSTVKEFVHTMEKESPEDFQRQFLEIEYTTETGKTKKIGMSLYERLCKNIGYS